jgi:uncharacterized protein
MKDKRWLSRSLLLLLLLSALPAIAEKVATMSAPTGYIDDYAGVISAPAKANMEALSRELHDKTKAQIFLVTIKTLEGEPVETFANELFAKWKIGEKRTDRGVLILFAINDRKRWIEIGYGFEGILNDAKVGDIGRDMVPALKAADYDEATKIGLQEISKIIAADSGVTLDRSLDSSTPGDQPASSASEPASQAANVHSSPWLFLLLIPLFLGPLIGFFVLFHLARKRGVTGPGWSSNSSGSSSSGNDSFSSSSGSDDSFDGGDGGSSGGGGAGGDW